MADITGVDKKYDDELRRERARLKETYAADKQLYEDVLAGGGAAYDTLKNEARINKALTDLAGGPGRFSLTHRQRGDMALRNELGKTERQHERFADNVAHALANLDIRHTADEAGLTATNAARRSAETVNKGRFDAELGIRKQQIEMNQADSVFDQMMKLYTKGLVNKAQFKALTGVEVKSLPKRRRRKSGSGAQSAAGQAIIDANKAMVEQAKAAAGGSFAKASLAQGGGGYTGVARDFAGGRDGTKTSRFDAADSANERYISTLKDDKDRYVKDFGKASYENALDYFTQRKAHAPFEGKGIYDTVSGYDSLMTGDASAQAALLSANKDNFVSRFGQGLYDLYMNHFAGLNGTGQHYSTEDRAAIDGAFNQILSAAASGEDIQSAIEAYQTAFDNAEKNLYGQHPGALEWRKVQAFFPEIAAQYDYEDTEEDNKRAAMGIQPESFTKEELIKALMTDSLDSFGNPIKDLRQRANIQEIRPYLNQLDETALLAVWAYIQSTKDSGSTAGRKPRHDEFVQAGKELFDRLRRQNDEVAIAAAQAVGDEYDSKAALEMKSKLFEQERDWDELPDSLRARYAREKLQNYYNGDPAAYYLTFDFDAAQQEIDDLNNQIDSKRPMEEKLLEETYIQNFELSRLNQEKLEQYRADEIVPLQVKKASKQAEIDMAKQYMVLSSDDFLKYAQEGANIAPSSVADVMFGGDEKNVVAYTRYLNSDMVMDELLDPQFSEQGGRLDDLEKWIDAQRRIYEKYTYMTDDEVGVYHYLLAKEGDASAREYLAQIEEMLNYRQGTAAAATHKDRPAAQLLYSIPAGIDSFGSGIRQLFSSDRLPATATQFASSAIYEDLGAGSDKKNFGQLVYDLGTGIGYMAPTILLSAVTGGLGAPAAVASGVGAAAMGLSAKGNAYNWALGEGYSKSQAETYSVLVGVSEGALQYLLGGVSKLGGKLSGNIAKTAIMNIDKALLRVAAELGVRMAGEGIEEGLQNILEPVFRNIAFGENNKIEVNEETWYQVLIGAITAGLLEGAPTVARNISNTRAGHAVQQAQKVDALITNALALDTKTEACKLAGKLADGSIHENQYNIGELLRAYVDAGGDTTFMYTPNLDTLAQSIQTHNGEILVPDLPDVNAILGDNSARTKNALADALDALGSLGVDTTTANRAYYDYLTAKAETKAAALSNALDAINATIDTAIAQRQSEGGDASVLTGLKMRLEGELSGGREGTGDAAYRAYLDMLDKVEAARESGMTAREFAQSQGVPSTLTDAEAAYLDKHNIRMQAGVSDKTMADSLAALLKLPADIQTQANVEAARQAYYDYLTADPKAKAATYDNAATLLSESAKGVLESAELDAGTRVALERLLGEIDNWRLTGDNISKRTEGRNAHTSSLENVMHAVGSASQAQSVLDGINPKYFNSDSRFGGGFYVGGDSVTIVAELQEHGSVARYAISYDMNLNDQKVLDLTDPKVASAWDFTHGLTSTNACQEIAETAQIQGYNVIKFESYRGGGINYVVYSNFEEVLIPRIVTPIN